MPQTETILVRFLDNGGTQAKDATLSIIHYNQADCLKRALKRLGLFWLLAVGSIPIIIAHWVLVPGFFIAGPIMAVLTYNARQCVDNCAGPCPSCNEQVSIKMEPKETLPKWTYCPSCNAPLHIEPQA